MRRSSRDFCPRRADGEHPTVDGRSVYQWEIDEALKLAGTRSSSPAPYT